PLSYAIMLVLGFAIMVFFNMSMIIVQTHVDDDYRGRVMGLYNLAFMGLIPIGGFLTGMCASWFGEQATVFAFAVIVCVFGFILHTAKPILRHLQ
ncbi:MAG: MFS transporter, partial [Caldisericia bacterium]|nr:MFS transporter [Caldisericia bacterium]